MPALFVFLLKVNIALLLFCAGYYLVLRHLTFYTLNRIYLMAAILFATVYPQINLSGFVQRHQQFTKPVQAVVVNWQSPVEAFIRPIAAPNYWHWVEVVFWAGAALLACRLLMQLYSLHKLYRNSKPAQIHDHDVRVFTSNAGPFSFWKSIFINPANHEPADLKAILLHEQVHVNEWHTLDILVAELSTIFYWFNPGVWLMKKAVRENIEFITDRKILNHGIDSKQYQYSLVNVGFAATSGSIVNHFNISTIKKRIIMMNAKRSSRFTLTRYAFLVPAVVGLLLVFSISKAALVKNSRPVFKIFSTIRDKRPSGIKRHTTAILPASTKPAVTEMAKIAAIAPATITKGEDTLIKADLKVIPADHSDTLNYVINGVKATKEEFKALDPDRIYAIEVLSPERAKKIVDQINNDHNVLFVTTDDSDAGKRFKEKIDALNRHSYTLAASTSVWNNEDAMTINGKAGAVTIKVPHARYRLNTLKKAHIQAWVNGKGVVTENEPVIVEEADSAGVHLMARARTKNALRAYSFNSVTPEARAGGKLIYTTPGHKLIYTPKALSAGRWNFNAETNISHLSTKMIMINGKEASEKDLKKLSAADIESMSVKTGEEVTKEYGDKAKNGVVFIVTKRDGR